MTVQAFRKTTLQTRLLQVDSKGDKRFSALYAELIVDQETKSLEEWYQTAKVCHFDKYDEKGGVSTELRAARNRQEGKGKFPSFIQWRGCRVHNIAFNHPLYGIQSTAMKEFYQMLWEIYLQQNPGLVDVLAEYGGFMDTFAKEGSVNQAEALRDIMDQKSSLFLAEPLVCGVCKMPKMIIAGHNPTMCSACGFDFAGKAWDQVQPMRRFIVPKITLNTVALPAREEES